MTNRSKAKNIALSGILIAFAVVFGTFSIPIGIAKVSPVQHFVNVVGAIILGPVYAVINAFIASLIRNVLGTGSLLAFPGSMVGALLSGIFYRKFKYLFSASIGEILGTGLLGALISYPIANIFLGKEGTIIMFVIPFTLSCTVGSIIAYLFLKVPIVNNILTDNEYEPITNKIFNLK